ncbi:MAG: membrane protein insertase YidC [Firmicutes bacterium]|nr:membrane protein insertase YidC [Bacillota bacterium]
METIILAATSSWILKPFAYVLSWIFNGLFYVISQIMTNQALAVTIIIFTFIVRALMMPLMLKQQRSSRRMARLQPKVNKIQEKYKNKKDPEAQQRMNQEIQQLYSENKANPMSGCLPLLIQMPILFALFEMLRNVPFYVTQIGDLYQAMAATVQNISGYQDVMNAETYASVVKGIRNWDPATTEGVIDFMYHLSRTDWQSFMETMKLTGDATFQQNYQLVNAYSTLGAGVLTFNLSETPGWKLWGIIFPIFSGATTFLSSWLMQRANDRRQKMMSPDGTVSQQQQTMKYMTYIFPVMTAWFTASMPLGLGLYWIVGNLFSILSQYISDSIIDKEEYKEALKRRDELVEKKKAREESRSKVDRATGGRIGTANTVSKSQMAGNRIAVQKEIQKKTETLEEQLRRLSMIDGKLPDEKYDDDQPDEPETIDVDYTEVSPEETTEVEKENE